MDALREQGAERFDPVRFHYLDALARRLDGDHRPGLAGTRQKLEQQLAALEQALQAARRHTDALIEQCDDPARRARLQALGERGEHHAARRLAHSASGGPRPGRAGPPPRCRRRHPGRARRRLAAGRPAPRAAPAPARPPPGAGRRRAQTGPESRRRDPRPPRPAAHRPADRRRPGATHRRRRPAQLPPPSGPRPGAAPRAGTGIPGTLRGLCGYLDGVGKGTR
ncbi:DUF2894 domain-containing protein [Alcanivorax sp. IO_7]|nr:DUF2894 domain-containing protein [Alcanivorax sp. IO_7]